MDRETEQMTPSRITIAQAEARLRDIADLVKINHLVAASRDRAQLSMDVLYSIQNAPTIADKRELKRLAGVALEAYEIPIVARQQT